jgi:hypothetical protein
LINQKSQVKLRSQEVEVLDERSTVAGHPNPFDLCRPGIVRQL